MRIATGIYAWREGQSLLFDGYVDHEAGNEAATRRVILMVDACLGDVEFARLQAWRTANRVAVDPKLVLVHPYTRATMA